ncbi:hypothetical protein AFE_0825 [Acidithiobacillus ferrooxidans ATCC 23270]|uniref:Uncharacterized protein n=1 Tax=Acidithiobacillus ferrooxidans (strain ATCC 23270 / DSM 14882 / CIP 104768 / NCIMB 8455) TaxID=243159 RepID=B7J6P1_ACIF2|nr:hypothetical protein AFE_0825 [Acidithiobacillus ferrooxidans ATCC 23270]
MTVHADFGGVDKTAEQIAFKLGLTQPSIAVFGTFPHLAYSSRSKLPPSL